MEEQFYEPAGEFEGINSGENGCIQVAIRAMTVVFVVCVGGICCLTVKGMPSLLADIAKKFFNED